ncbi:hypothetical protein CYLTODRAFT_454346 [Cylindrobasidium torrendii FP15055 ss-10]|uniref:Uncharacterized protein n=1 Tax=Cylindrobasidium torrendii FP15055 ss-10 TaxID=1314674 RepID=A0A0D7BBA7_9AGAR|nr:hypothetical protein CYLTODRAFT_454346 [Cylindrobasidium torrendii FP15055 ss-10]
MSEPSAETSAAIPSLYEQIANIKPTHREVIGGIAPHVFDDGARVRGPSRRRPRTTSGHHVRRARHLVQGTVRPRSIVIGSDTPSPLRLSSAIAVHLGDSDVDADEKCVPESIAQDTTAIQTHMDKKRPSMLRMLSLWTTAAKFKLNRLRTTSCQ